MEVREDGLPSCTRYAVLERTQHFSLVQCFLETGRQHQIRVHLASLGHPLVGDKLYGPDERYFLQAMQGELDDVARERLRLSRQALHSYTLGFVHPQSKERVELQSQLPSDMAELLESDRRPMA
jgi:23S rRNA pseudouridine1911/1915/1917 synthase